jgi:ligand-binding sensor domain-containing protein
MVWRDGTVKRFPQFQRIRALYQDRTGTIWIGAEAGGGVVRYKDGAFTSLDAAIGSSPENPVAYVFAEDAEGALYIGLARRGVIKIKDGAITSYESTDGVAATDIRAIYPDKEGNLWVGTKGQGLVVLREGRWWHADGFSDPFNDHVSALIEDDQGRFWVGTPKGIVWGLKAEFLAVARGERSGVNLHSANVSDGVRPSTVGGGSFPDAGKTPDGAIWFATRRGLTIVDPRKVTLNRSSTTKSWNGRARSICPPARATWRSITRPRVLSGPTRCFSATGWKGMTTVGSKPGRPPHGLLQRSASRHLWFPRCRLQ